MLCCNGEESESRGAGPSDWEKRAETEVFLGNSATFAVLVGNHDGNVEKEHRDG